MIISFFWATPFLRSAYVVYDMNNTEISLAQASTNVSGDSYWDTYYIIPPEGVSKAKKNVWNNKTVSYVTGVGSTALPTGSGTPLNGDADICRSSLTMAFYNLLCSSGTFHHNVTYSTFQWSFHNYHLVGKHCMIHTIFMYIDNIFLHVQKFLIASELFCIGNRSLPIIPCLILLCRFS